MSFKVFISIFVFCSCAISTIQANEYACKDIKFVSRRKWGARHVTGYNSIPTVAHIFIHHTPGSYCLTTSECKSLLRGIQINHMDYRKFRDIGYAYVIGGDGKVYEGRGWGVEGAHTRSFNNLSYGITFIGDFSNILPTKPMLRAAKRLIECGVQKGFIQKDYELHGHTDSKTSYTSCPGKKLEEEIKKWAHFEYII